MSSSLQCNHHYILHNATLFERIPPPATICILLFKPPLNSIPHTPQKTTRPNNRTTCDMCFSVRPLSILSLSVCLLTRARRCLDPRSRPDELTSPSVPKNSYSRKHTWPMLSPLPLCIGKRVFIPPPHSPSLPPSLMMINRFVYMCMCLCLRYHRRNLYNITVSDTQQPQEYHSSVTDW